MNIEGLIFIWSLLTWFFYVSSFQWTEELSKINHWFLLLSPLLSFLNKWSRYHRNIFLLLDLGDEITHSIFLFEDLIQNNIIYELEFTSKIILVLIEFQLYNPSNLILFEIRLYILANKYFSSRMHCMWRGSKNVSWFQSCSFYLSSWCVFL